MALRGYTWSAKALHSKTKVLHLEYKKADGSNEKSRNGPLKCLYFKVPHHIVMGNGSVKPCIVA